MGAGATKGGMQQKGIQQIRGDGRFTFATNKCVWHFFWDSLGLKGAWVEGKYVRVIQTIFRGQSTSFPVPACWACFFRSKCFTKSGFDWNLMLENIKVPRCTSYLWDRYWYHINITDIYIYIYTYIDIYVYMWIQISIYICIFKNLHTRKDDSPNMSKTPRRLCQELPEVSKAGGFFRREVFRNPNGFGGCSDGYIPSLKLTAQIAWKWAF